jgi:endonuclease/exonuclease/phosphatase (EEP) superfamily protein YafD
VSGIKVRNNLYLALIKSRNAHQIAHLYSWINSVLGGLPAIIGGDFNAPESSARMKRLRSFWLDTFRSLHPDSDGTTHELFTPQGKAWHRSRLDYIFLRHGKSRWKVLETRHLDGCNGPHSDHRAVLTRLLLTS